ncbi:hypothetical protein Pmgp_00803 [Pelotomaculum propionicicum]|uniref:Wadjet protein JetD C-terminal domain-containing protein n=2 Tax=Pelotomaculum propionicicum TaxID=258475 RepID=A0A4Y7RX16_9FIRM|nr:hypothetical protein [Peptococcaceae bacterium]TEB12827.1 hypothetical protein Pmgp_00803 [Pelotomaculum propionicicum]
MRMKTTYDILNALLDRYERSATGKTELSLETGNAVNMLPGAGRASGERSDGTGPEGQFPEKRLENVEKPARRIWFHFNRKNLPAYFDDTSARPKSEINESCLVLAGRGLIEIRWVKHEEGNLIEKVALNTKAVGDAYRYLGRKPRAAAASEVCALARTYSAGAPSWAASFFSCMAERLSRGESVARYFDIGDLERVELLFKAVREAAVLKDETPRRVFSQRVLGDSKAFDSVAGSLARAARDFHPAFRAGEGEGEGEREGWEQKEVLAELGLVDNPQHLFISGPLKFSVEGRVVDTEVFTPDLGLPSEMVRQMEVLEISAERVITIENLTAYYEFIKRHPGRFLTVYLGGYHNSPRRLFLTKLRGYLEAAGREVAFYHWGDIDYGGFTIFNHLRGKCGLELKPLCMDVATLRRYEQFGLPFDRAYGQRLRRLLEQEEYRLFHEVILYMLEKGIRLEQECVEVDR